MNKESLPQNKTFQLLDPTRWRKALSRGKVAFTLMVRGRIVPSFFWHFSQKNGTGGLKFLVFLIHYELLVNQKMFFFKVSLGFLEVRAQCASLLHFCNIEKPFTLRVNRVLN